MSQIHYDIVSDVHGRVHVQTGWDHMLRKYHLTVWANNEDEEIIIDDLMEPEPLESTTNVIALLNRENIGVPECLPHLLATHKLKNLGNIIETVECIE